MNCCVIGAGAQGSATAAILTRLSEVSQVVLADSNLDLAERVAKKLDSEKVRTASVDATDAGSVASVAEGSDIILNLVHMEYAAAVRKGALAVGCDYVDSCSDSPFLEDLAFKGVIHDDGEFKKAGISGVTGAGWAPGVANVLCRYAVDQMDEVDEIVIRLGYQSFGIDPSEVAHPWLPHFSPEVALQDYGEPSLVFTHGAPTFQGPFANAEVVDFGGSIGAQLVASHSHDESYTLPHFVGKGMKECDFRYPVNDQAATLVAMGMADPHRVVTLEDGTEVKPFDVVMACVKRPAENFFAESKENVSHSRNIDRAILVEATGRSAGVPMRVRIPYYIHVTDELREHLLEACGTWTVWVAAPMVVAAEMILAGRTPKGIVAPEALDPLEFLQRLAHLGYPVGFDVECIRSFSA